jgi:hypothetical protein
MKRICNLKKVAPTKEQLHNPDNVFVLEETIKAGIKRLRNRGSTIYDRYYARNQINIDMHNAATLYYTHYFLGHERTTTIVKYGERLGEGSVPTLTSNEYQEHHRQVYEKAREHIKAFNPKLATFIDDVILYDVDLRSAAKKIRHQPENGYSLFCITLESLVDFFLYDTKD